MRGAIVAALLADEGVAAIVGERVYAREGALGGVSLHGTPEAFADGELLPSLVVWLEGRRALAGQASRGVDGIAAEQTVAVAGLHAGPGYDAAIRPALRAATLRLHGRQTTPATRLVPVRDPIRWTDLRWASDSGELLDPELGCPIIIARFTAVIADDLTTPWPEVTP